MISHQGLLSKGYTALLKQLTFCPQKGGRETAQLVDHRVWCSAADAGSRAARDFPQLSMWALMQCLYSPAVQLIALTFFFFFFALHLSPAGNLDRLTWIRLQQLQEQCFPFLNSESSIFVRPNKDGCQCLGSLMCALC